MSSNKHSTTSDEIASQVVQDLANVLALGDEIMPDTATGRNLDRWLKIVDLRRRSFESDKGARARLLKRLARGPRGV